MSKKKAILITLFLGGLGVHRFMAGKIWTGLLWMLTGGCFAIGFTVDLVKVCRGTFKDYYGHPWGTGEAQWEARGRYYAPQGNGVAGRTYAAPQGNGEAGRTYAAPQGNGAAGRTYAAPQGNGAAGNGARGYSTRRRHLLKKGQRQSYYGGGGTIVMILLLVLLVGVIVVNRDKVFGPNEYIEKDNYVDNRTGAERIEDDPVLRRELAVIRGGWELTDYMDDATGEMKTADINDFWDLFPYKVDEENCYVDKDREIVAEFSRESPDILNYMVVEGDCPEISVYGMKIGMSMEEIEEIIVAKRFGVTMEEDGWRLTQKDSAAVVHICYDEDTKLCNAWEFKRREDIASGGKKTVEERCLDLVQERSFAGLDVTYREALEGIYGNAGIWTCGAESVKTDWADEECRSVMFEAGDDYILWYVGEEAMLYDASIQNKRIDYYLTLEAELIAAIPSGMRAEISGGNNSGEAYNWGEDIRTQYILPESNSRYLSRSDLLGLSKEECRLARNEIYARYGRKFNDEALQAYFNSCSWYYPLIEPENFQESMLNEYEVANKDLIVDFEQQYADGAGAGSSSAAEASGVEEVIVGIWHNGNTDWATNYHTVFYEDGMVEHFGYRNYDYGYWELDDRNNNKVTAYYDQYYDAPSYGRQHVGSYACEYYYNSATGYLERTILPGEAYDDSTNDVYGTLQKVDEIVEDSYY